MKTKEESRQNCKPTKALPSEKVTSPAPALEDLLRSTGQLGKFANITAFNSLTQPGVLEDWQGGNCLLFATNHVTERKHGQEGAKVR